MGYEEYERRILRIHEWKKRIYKFRYVISSLLLFCLALFFTLFSTKGLIIQDSILNEEYTYGEPINRNSSAFMASAPDYQYKSESSTDWSYEVPTHPGTYSSRSVSLGNYGNPLYGKTQKFRIVKRKADVAITSQLVEYGNLPSIDCNLVNGDSVYSYNVVYSDITKEKTQAEVKKDDFIIHDKDGNDVTDCYDFTFRKSDIEILPVPLHFVLESKTSTYDSSILVGGVYKINQEDLVYGDKIVEAETSGSLVDVGTTSNCLESFKVIDSLGQDVTVHYTPIVEDGLLRVGKRKLLLKSEDVIKTYDGSTDYELNVVVDESTPLVEGHSIQVVDRKADDGNAKENDPISFKAKVIDESGIDVSGNYDIEYEYGKLDIHKRKVIVDILTSYIYASQTGNQIDSSYYTLSGDGILGRDVFTLSTGNLDQDGNMTFEYSILNRNQEDNRGNYDVEFTANKPEVKKKNVIVKTESRTFLFDGTSHDLRIFSYSVRDKDGNLVTLDNQDVLKMSGFPTILHAGEIQNKPAETKIIGADGSDRTSYYDIDFQYGTLKMEKRKAVLTLSNNVYDYDGEYHTPVLDEKTSIDGEEQSGILPLHHITIDTGLENAKVKNPVQDYRITLDNQKDIEVGSSSANFHYSILGNDSIDYTGDYDILVNDGGIRINRRKINIQVSGFTRYYDGTALNEQEYIDKCFQVDNLIPTDRINILGLAPFHDVGTYENPILRSNIRIMDKNDNDVTSCYEILSFDAQPIIVKRAKIVYYNKYRQPAQFDENNKASFVYDGKDKTIDFVTGDYSVKEDESDYPKEGYSLVIQGGASGRDVGNYASKQDNVSLLSSTTDNPYYHVDILSDKIDSAFYLQGNQFEIQKRKLTIKTNSDFIYYMRKYATIDDDYLNSHKNELFTIENLAQGDTVHFSLKIDPSKCKEGDSFKYEDLVSYRIYDHNGRDITDLNYEASFDNASGYRFFFRKIHVNLVETIEADSTTIVVEETYDGESHGVSYSPWRCQSDTGLDFTVEYTSEKRTFITDGEGEIHYDDIRSTYDGYEYSLTNGEIIIENIDTVKKAKFKIVQREMELSFRNLPYQQFEDNAEIIWYDGRSISFRKEDTDKNQYLNLFDYLKASNLAFTDRLVVSLKDGKSLPTGEMTFNFNDYFTVKAIHTQDNRDVSDCYSCYDEKTGALKIPDKFYKIKKINIAFNDIGKSENSFNAYSEKEQMKTYLDNISIDKENSQMPDENYFTFHRKYFYNGNEIEQDEIGLSEGSYSSSISTVTFQAFDGYSLTSDGEDGILTFHGKGESSADSNRTTIHIRLEDYKTTYLNGYSKPVDSSIYLEQAMRETTAQAQADRLISETAEIRLTSAETYSSIGSYILGYGQIKASVVDHGKKEDSYNFVFDTPSMKIDLEKPTLHVTLKGQECVYDGSSKGYLPSEYLLVDGESVPIEQINIEYDSDAVSVGTYERNVESVKVMIGGRWYTSDELNIEVNLDQRKRSIRITKRKINIVSKTRTIVYDGKDHSMDTSLVYAINLASGDSLNYRIDSEMKNPGTYKIIPKNCRIINENGEDVTGCYDITYSYGTLTIVSSIEF